VTENELTAVTIFVNPTQFNNPYDLTNYPSTWEQDIEKLEKAGVDYLLYPEYDDLYRDAYRYKIIENEDSGDLCGAARPDHFNGVLTVVMKLLAISRATRAYFGEKDWQQFSLIKGMADAFFIDTEIVSCPIVREESGLALSSRNKLITDKNRKIAPLLYKIISSDYDIDEMKKKLTDSGFVIDYLKIKDNRIFAAVFLGEVRLIDNVSI
ncbi:MAG: pantoate--beta-alanine ligase, partial [Spirochaetales bacterium]|nr:pantoate--beta-alanine ligase [Spirochaetales bacterium]